MCISEQEAVPRGYVGRLSSVELLNRNIRGTWVSWFLFRS